MTRTRIEQLRAESGLAEDDAAALPLPGDEGLDDIAENEEGEDGGAAEAAEAEQATGFEAEENEAE